MGGVGVGLGVRVDVNEVFCENSKKKYFFYFFFWGGVGLGRQSGCERRIEVFVKIQKKKLGGGRGGVGGSVGSRVGGSKWL